MMGTVMMVEAAITTWGLGEELFQIALTGGQHVQ